MNTSELTNIAENLSQISIGSMDMSVAIAATQSGRYANVMQEPVIVLAI